VGDPHGHKSLSSAGTIEAQQVRVIVLDLEMPVMDGIEFLRLLGRTHPGQQVVMLSGRTGPRRAQGLAGFGCEPVSGETDLAGGIPRLIFGCGGPGWGGTAIGFRGLMQSMSLEDLIQMECLARKSSILVVSTGKRRGEIYVCDGEIVHAVSGQLQAKWHFMGCWL
jgi:CheY-like chemotaxis protein